MSIFDKLFSRGGTPPPLDVLPWKVECNETGNWILINSFSVEVRAYRYASYLCNMLGQQKQYRNKTDEEIEAMVRIVTPEGKYL